MKGRYLGLMLVFGILTILGLLMVPLGIYFEYLARLPCYGCSDNIGAAYASIFAGLCLLPGIPLLVGGLLGLLLTRKYGRPKPDANSKSQV